MSAAKRDPDLLRAGQALAENDLPTAETILRPYLKRRPTDAPAIRMMAELAEGGGRHSGFQDLLGPGGGLGLGCAMEGQEAQKPNQRRSCQGVPFMDPVHRHVPSPSESIMGS